jgi:uridine phosphorylase
MTLRHFIGRRGITVEEIGVAPVVVISWGRGMVTDLAEATGAIESPHWFYAERNPLYTGSIDGRKVSFILAPVGAAGTVMFMEELIACGAQIFLGLGWAGSLQTYAPVGSMLIPTQCIREEGTSFHYVDASAELGPDAELMELLRDQAALEGIQVLVGPQWTIDAPYRELVSKVEKYRAEGIQGVDMETSAMYALGLFRGVRVCNLLVVSDELWHEWRPAFGSSELEVANQLAQQIILHCLREERLFSPLRGQPS